MAMTRTMAPSVQSHARWLARSTTAPCAGVGQLAGSGGARGPRGAGSAPRPDQPAAPAEPLDPPDHARTPLPRAAVATVMASTADLHIGPSLARTPASGMTAR